MDDRNIYGIIGISFVTGLVVGRKGMYNKLVKKRRKNMIDSEIAVLTDDLMTYAYKNMLNTEVSLEEYTKTIDEKKKFIEIVKEL